MGNLPTEPLFLIAILFYKMIPHNWGIVILELISAIFLKVFSYNLISKGVKFEILDAIFLTISLLVSLLNFYNKIL